MPGKLYEELWAKNHGLVKPYPLLAHMLDSACMAGQLFDLWLRPTLRSFLEEHLGSNAKSVVMWLVGCHDVGKANPIFQGQLGRGVILGSDEVQKWADVRAGIEKAGSCNFSIPDVIATNARAVKAYRRHEQVSASFFLKGHSGDMPWTVEEWTAIPSMGHHGRFSVPFAEQSNRIAAESRKRWQAALEECGWLQAQKELEDRVRRACGVESIPEEVDPTVSILISGLTVISDRLVSSLEWVERSQNGVSEGKLLLNEQKDWLDRQSQEAAVTIKEQLGIYTGWSSPEAAQSDILGPFEPRPAQQAAMEDPDGLLTIMAATGSGKTEAALLRHAQREERLLFLLPTMATSNALMKRVQKAFCSTPNTGALAHSMATIEDFYSRPLSTFADCCETVDTGGLVPADFVRTGMGRMLASVTVGTVDQALKAALPIKWIHLLLLSLANSHVVIDEVHTLDSYQAELLKLLLSWLGRTHTRVTLLSATLSQRQCSSFSQAYAQTPFDTKVEFPSIISGTQSAQPLDSPKYSIEYIHHCVDPDALVQTHVDWTLETRKQFPKARIGIICNRVDRAQEVAAALHEAGEKVLLLHARMTAGHRQATADELLDLIGPQGSAEALCVVGTQAIEASLDIDLDLLSTDLCPSASLIQRAGRVWRRTDPARAQRTPGLQTALLHIVEPKNYEQKENLPYLVAMLQRTGTWLRQHKSIRVPDDCQELVDACTVLLYEDLSEDDLDALSEDACKASIAKNRLAPLDAALRDDSSLEVFSALTNSPADLDDIATRLIEEDTFRAILVDDSQQIPGAMTADEALALCTTKPTQKQIRDALRGSINVRTSVFPPEDPRRLPFSCETGVLKAFVFLSPVGSYDSFLGMLQTRKSD
ncbi:MAG: CRISPR-associated helicase Cas3' [Corynebacterium sp.]|nr:CRISPR-associated helicase Cas3' [Corynebacterium sp.]